MLSKPKPWDRMIALVDMNAFFASIEQRDNPEIQNKPVAVTNGLRGTCIITCSYEARALGIKTGMRLNQARQLCPELIQRPAQPKRYAQVSTRLMRSLEAITPDIEVFSVDEAFLDVTRCQSLWGSAESIGKRIKKIVAQSTSITASIGISGDKTTAKWAAKLHKPNGLTIIPPWESKHRLQDIPVTDLCGIAKGIGQFLERYGVYTCGDMEKIPISVLARQYGHPGRRIWAMCQGKDPDKVHTVVSPPKSVGHGKILPPNTTDRTILLTYFQHMCEKVAARLRRHNMQSKKFFIGMRTNSNWLGEKFQWVQPTNNARNIMELCYDFINKEWVKQGIFQVQVTALQPEPSDQQLELFPPPANEKNALNNIMDSINNKFGEFSLSPTRLINHP